ncbi:hypothetical protein CKBE_00053 [Candidatus Kinetoplastibacterium blastocrithidii (ex Strigomonas culicis)]|nr:hypothetical protein CKBE_00053 [Candidatus Kinetoplastibacterium blastocrithidii (ex Strigomonas culicis)]
MHKLLELLATVSAVGKSNATSLANEGPDNMPCVNFDDTRSLCIISCIKLEVLVSSPLHVHITGISSNDMQSEYLDSSEQISETPDTGTPIIING